MSKLQTLCAFAATAGLSAGIVGPNSVGWYQAGLAAGMWLAALYVWLVD